MKKTTRILLAILTALSLALCPALAEEQPDLAGVWYASMQGIQVTLTLNPNGTCSLELRGTADDALWEQEGNKVYVEHGAGDKLIMTYDGENLVMSDDPKDPMAMVFRRELKVTSLEDFQGDWKATLVNVMGLPVPAEEAGMEIVIRIEDETVLFLKGAESDEDRVLKCLYSDDQLTKTTETATYVISYLENDTLQMRELLGEQAEILVYLERYDPEAETQEAGAEESAEEEAEN